MKHNYIITTLILLLCSGATCTLQAQTLTRYAKQKQQEIDERKRVEKQKYEEACQEGTLQALQNYARLYPKSKYINDVNNRIEDFSLWSSAKSQNTLLSYNQYLQQSRYKSFEKEARAAIVELDSQEEWNSIRHSENKDEVKNFISKYPNSTCKGTAQERVCELEGIDLYRNGDLLAALSKFNEAGGKNSISPTNQAAYDECKEFYDYKKIVTATDGETFLRRYPNSAYYNQVSNRVARLKALSLTTFSSEQAYAEALSYAKDKATRDTVKSYIKAKKDSYKEYMRQQRRNRIMANGGYVQFGIEFANLESNKIDLDWYTEILYYNAGASIKVGNYRSPVQFEVGAKLGFNIEEPKKYHMPAYARLKVNICSCGSNCKFYATGIVTYNAIIAYDREDDWAVGGGLGFAWRHLDWFTLYYKQDLSKEYTLGNSFLGTSFVYYLF